MALGGDLSKIDLTAIFQTLALNQQIGTLVVTDRDSNRKTSLYFDVNAVTLVSSDKKNYFRLGQILVNRGIISEEVLRRALETQKRAGGLLGQHLCEMGVTTEEEIEEVVRGQIEEEIFELFQWKHARFEFLEGTAPNRTALDGYITSLAFDPNTLLMEAARRLDEWEGIKQKIRNLDEILILDEDAWEDYEFDELDPAERAILDLLDGERNIEGIAAETSLARFEICSRLAQWLEQGKVRPLTLAELEALAQECESKNNIPLAIRFYERALSHDPNAALYNEKLARCYELIGEGRKAARFYSRLGDLRWGDGAQVDAVTAYRKAVVLDAQDVHANERLFEYAAAAGDAEGVLSVGKTLLRAYLKELQIAEAGDLCRGLMERFPADIELRKAMINIHLDRRDAKAAAKEYEEILELLKPTRNWAEMAEICSKIVQLDPERDDYRALIESYRIRADRTLKKILLRPQVLIPIVGVFLLLMVSLIGYNWLAQREYYRAQELAAAEHFEEAVKAYGTVAGTYGWSFFASAAEQRRREIEATQADLREELGQKANEVAELMALVQAALEKQMLFSARTNLEQVLRLTASLKGQDTATRVLRGQRDQAEAKLTTVRDRLAKKRALIEEAGRVIMAGNLAQGETLLAELDGWELDEEAEMALRRARAELVRLRMEQVALDLHLRYVEAREAERLGDLEQADRAYAACLESSLENLEWQAAGAYLQSREEERAKHDELVQQLVRLRKLGDWVDLNREVQRVVLQIPGSGTHPVLRQELRYALRVKGLPVGTTGSLQVLEGSDVVGHTEVTNGTYIDVPACRHDGTSTVGQLRLILEVPGFAVDPVTLTASNLQEALVEFQPRKAPLIPPFPPASAGVGELQGGVIASEGRIFAPSLDGNLYAFDQRTGAALWVYEGAESNDLAAPPLLAGTAGLLLEGLLNGNRFLAISTVDRDDHPAGSLQWSVEASGHIKGRAALAQDLVVFACTDGSVHGVTLAGTEVWSTQVSGRVEADVLTDGERFFVATLLGQVHCLELDGNQRWQVSTDGGVESCLAVTDGVVFAGTDRGSVHALRAINGGRVWPRTRYLGRRLRVQGGVAVLGPALVVAATEAAGNDRGVCFALDRKDGSDLATAYQFTRDPLVARPLVVPELQRIYLGTRYDEKHGTIYALQLLDGELTVRWHWVGEYPISGLLSFSDGLLCAGTQGGQIVVLPD